MKRPSWFEAALVLAVMAIHLYAAVSDAHNFPARWFTRDDAYFYFKTAQNISAGLGSTFDGINPTNGYHPLWMVVCIPIFALARFDLILPLRLLTLVMGALSAATGVLIFRLLKPVVIKPVAMLAAAYWVFDTYIHETVTQFGLETGLLAFTLALLLRRLQNFEAKWQSKKNNEREILILAGLATAVFLSRLDMIFVAGLVGLWIILRGTPARYFLITDGLIIVSSVLVSFAARLGFPQYYDYAKAALITAAALLMMRVPLLYLLKLYEHSLNLSPLQTLARLGLATGLSSGLAGIALWLLGSRLNGFPRTALLIEAGLSFILLVLSRLGALWFAKSKEHRYKALDWKRIARETVIFYAVLGGTLAAYMLFNLALFGTATPISGQVKRWWGAPVNQVRGGPAGTLEAFLGLDRNGDFNAWPQVVLVAEEAATWITQHWPTRLLLPRVYAAVLISLLAAGFLTMFAGRRRCLHATQRLGLVPLFAGCGFQVLSYNATGYSAVKEWYWAGEMLFTILLAALLITLILPRLLKHPAAQKTLCALAVFASLFWFARLAQDVYLTMPLRQMRADRPYVEALSLLESQTEPGSAIGVTGGGSLGYFIQDRSIVNIDGLINSPAYFRAMQAGKAADYLYESGVDYIFANPDILSQLAPFKTQFKGRLIRLGISYGGKELMRIRPPGQ